LLASWWFVMHRVMRFGLPVWVLGIVLTVPMLMRAAESPQRRWFRALVVISVGITCMISSFVPLHALLGRIRTSEWTRASYYRYPEIIDKLPAGAVVLNATGASTLNFPLAGRSLSNRVIADLEAPATLSTEFLQTHAIDYVITTTQSSESHEQVPGAILLHKEVVRNGMLDVEWRIWRVQPRSPEPARHGGTLQEFAR
jgi:hypothetical protein